VLVTVGSAVIPCLLVCLIFERTSGLRITVDQELAGLDQTYWGTSNFAVELVSQLDGERSSAAPGSKAGVNGSHSSVVASASR
jgi:hypothetical protein